MEVLQIHLSILWFVAANYGCKERMLLIITLYNNYSLGIMHGWVYIQIILNLKIERVLLFTLPEKNVFSGKLKFSTESEWLISSVRMMCVRFPIN